MVRRAESSCIICPFHAYEGGVDVAQSVVGREVENVISIPYVWIASRSPNKIREIGKSLGIIGQTPGKTSVLIDSLIAFPDDIMPHAPEEQDLLYGEDIAVAKVLAYWRSFANNPAVSQCHLFKSCFDQHLFIANDVNVWTGVAGHGYEQSLRKPGGLSIKTRKGLIKHIMETYKPFAGAHFVDNRIEAAVAMLRPTSKNWREEQDLQIRTGKMRAYVQFPVAPLSDAKFIGRYVDYAEAQSGGFDHLLGAAGGIMTEYWVNALIKEGHEVSVSMVADDRYRDNPGKLLLAIARGVPPRLLWKLMAQMYGVGSAGNGEKVLVMEPEGGESDMAINQMIEV